MDYKNKYVKYKAKYLHKNILKTGGTNSSPRSMKEKQEEKDRFVELLEQLRLKQINDCNKLEESKEKEDCKKKANEDFESSTRKKSEKSRKSRKRSRGRTKSRRKIRK